MTVGEFPRTTDIPRGTTQNALSGRRVIKRRLGHISDIIGHGDDLGKHSDGVE